MHTRASIQLGLCLLGALTASAVQVTFQIDTSVQTALGQFDPATDGVFVAGDAINSWSATASELTRSETNPKVWVGTFDVPGAEGDTVQYKFVLNTAAGTRWEGNVGPVGPNGNRSFVLAAEDQVLPLVYFNNVTEASGVKPRVTFQVDLSVQAAAGNFDPAADTVTVAGEFNNWSTTASALANSAEQPGIWRGTFEVTGAANSVVSYKFVLNGGTWEGNVGPNGSQNRVFTLTAQDQVLPVVFFNNAAGEAAVIPLTFQVNMGVQIAQGRFDPAADTVTVAGDPLNGWSPTASPLSRKATDPNVWEGVVEVTASPGSTLQFKFVVNEGATWEGGDNRAYTVSGPGAQSVPAVFFNRVESLGQVALTAAGNQVTLTWTAGPLIRLQRASSVTGAWEDVPNSQGQNSVSLPLGTGPVFFRLVGP